VNITFTFTQQVNSSVLDSLRSVLASELGLPESNVMILVQRNSKRAVSFTVVVQVIFTDTSKSMRDTVTQVESAIASGSVTDLFATNDIAYDPSTVSVSGSAETGSDEGVKPSSGATKVEQIAILMSAALVATLLL